MRRLIVFLLAVMMTWHGVLVAQMALATPMNQTIAHAHLSDVDESDHHSHCDNCDAAHGCDAASHLQHHSAAAIDSSLVIVFVRLVFERVVAELVALASTDPIMLLRPPKAAPAASV